MGMLAAGVWKTDAVRTEGAFVRPDSSFHGRVTADGRSGFKAEAGRYHLYVSLACPWAHRTLIMRTLKGLEDVLSISVVAPVMGDGGWSFADEPGCIADNVNGSHQLHQIYTKAKPDYSGRVTVPVLWDKKTAAIVNNESSEILRMLNGEFNAFAKTEVDFYPPELRDEIDALNAIIYATVNNGVYRAGFATTQVAYDTAFDALFATLDDLESRLARQRYLCGERLTEADWRLFPTLVRFDAVYYGHFKCNLRRLVDYPNLWAYTRELYQIPGIAGTIDMGHIKRHYYGSHRTLNPTRIVPRGPAINFAAPHDRDRIGKKAAP